MAPGLRDPVVSSWVEPPCVEGRGAPLDVRVGGDELVHAQRHRAVWVDGWVVPKLELSPGKHAGPGPKRHQVLPEARQAPALVQEQMPRVIELVIQGVKCHVWVVGHPHGHEQGTVLRQPPKYGPTCSHLYHYPFA